MFLSLVLFSFLTLIVGPGDISFTGSDSRDKVCFFDTSFRARAHVFSPGFRDKDVSFLAQASNIRCVSLTLGLDSGCSVIGQFPALGLVGSVGQLSRQR